MQKGMLGALAATVKGHAHTHARVRVRAPVPTLLHAHAPTRALGATQPLPRKPPPRPPQLFVTRGAGTLIDYAARPGRASEPPDPGAVSYHRPGRPEPA